jgi:hypothetical protein
MNEHIVLTLLTVAGVAATFAGFSGVVAVFDRRAHGEWFPEELFRLTNMLVMSLGACLFSLIPLIAESFHLSESALWALSSVSFGAFCTAYWVIAWTQRGRVARLRPGTLSVWAQAVVTACLSAALVLQGLNAGAVIVQRGPGPFVAGLWLLLIAAGLQFAFLVLEPLRSTTNEG